MFYDCINFFLTLYFRIERRSEIMFDDCINYSLTSYFRIETSVRRSEIIYFYMIVLTIS
jgi:hypothetical protein